MIRRVLVLLALFASLFPSFARSAAPRVVSLAPHTTEMVIAAGGQQQLVAAVPGEGPLAASVKRLAVIGGIDRELILALEPDLVIAWESGNRASDITWLRTQGLPVYLSEPDDLEQVATDILAIGHLMGTEKQAQEAAARFTDSLISECAALPEQEVYIEVWDHPPMSLGGSHWLNEAISRVRLTNTYRDYPRSVFSIDRESLMSKGELPRLALRADSPLGSQLLGRPGPLLAKGIQELCAQRQQSPQQTQPIAR